MIRWSWPSPGTAFRGWCGWVKWPFWGHVRDRSSVVQGGISSWIYIIVKGLACLDFITKSQNPLDARILVELQTNVQCAGGWYNNILGENGDGLEKPFLDMSVSRNCSDSVHQRFNFRLLVGNQTHDSVTSKLSDIPQPRASYQKGVPLHTNLEDYYRSVSLIERKILY